MHFPSRNSILLDPKQFSVVSQSEKLAKEKKILCSFAYFFLSFSIFHLPFYNFPSFPLHFPFFSLAFLFPVGQQKFPSENCQGGTLPYAPLAVMPLGLGVTKFLLMKMSWFSNNYYLIKYPNYIKWWVDTWCYITCFLSKHD